MHWLLRSVRAFKAEKSAFKNQNRKYVTVIQAIIPTIMVNSGLGTFDLAIPAIKTFLLRRKEGRNTAAAVQEKGRKEERKKRSKKV